MIKYQNSTLVLFSRITYLIQKECKNGRIEEQK
jgi:hypothetical protein